jgi:hypothetical protein
VFEQVLVCGQGIIDEMIQYLTSSFTYLFGIIQYIIHIIHNKQSASN